MRFLPDLIEICGFGCIVAAAWLLALPLGLLALGIALVILANEGGGP